MRLAYLTTKYPAVSHTFIRRELREMERRGHAVLRLAIRPTDTILADPLDREEAARSMACLAQPPLRLLAGVLGAVVARPRAFLRALCLALRMGFRSERGLLAHLAYLVEAANILQLLRRHEIEHVHAHFGTNPAAVARLIRRLGGPPYSFTVHGPDEFDAPRRLDLRGKIADAAFVVAISYYCAAQLRRWAAPADWRKIEVVHCAVGDDFFSAARPVDPASRTLVCIGRLAPQKGQMLLLDAFAGIVAAGVDARLVLAGDGELRPVLEQRASELGLGDRVTITGWIGEAEIRRQLLAARVLVLPSFAEGLPVVIMEAFALGRPVISTYVAGIPELVRPGENGWLVPAGNTEELAAAMRAALESPAEALDTLGAAGQARVRQRYRTAGEAVRLEELLVAQREVAGHANPGGCIRRGTLGTTSPAAARV